MVIENPFSGLINGVLQGHAIAQQLHNQALQDEAYRRAKDREDRENQLADLQSQMYLQEHGRPVGPGGTIQESFNAAVPDATGLDIPAAPQPVSYARPADKARTVKLKLSTGETPQYELYSPEEKLQRQLDTAKASAMVQAQTAGLTDIIKGRMQREDLDLRRRTSGREAPDIMVRAGLAVPGEKLLPEEIIKGIPEAQKILQPQLKDVAPGASLVSVPPASVGAPAAAGAPGGSAFDFAGTPGPILPPGSPLAGAAATGQDNRQAFVDKAKAAAAGSGTGATVLFKSPDKPEANVTEAELAYRAVNAKTQEERDAAKAAIAVLDKSKIASRPVTNTNVYAGVPTAPLTGAAAQVHGEEYLKTLPPAFAARVRNVAIGNELPPTGRQASTGAGKQVLDAVYQFDPQYTSLVAQARKKTLDEFTSTQIGHAGGQLLALNTLVHHADLYQQVGEALQNGSFRPGNEAWNRVRDLFGAAPPTDANLVARFLAGETGKVATGGVPGEQEVNGILANLKTDAGPDQIKSAGQRILQIAAGRMTPLKELRDKNKLQGIVDILGPDAQEILTRRGFDPETMKPVGGAHQVLPKPTSSGQAVDAATVQAYLRANGNDKDKTRKALTDAGWTIPAAQ